MAPAFRSALVLALALPAAAAESPFKDAQLRGLRGAIARYRAIESRGGWPAVPPLEGGERGAAALSLRRRLALTGDLPRSASKATDLDEGLRAALRRFQRRHGIPASGDPDPETLAALNRPVETRLRQLEESLARAQDLRVSTEPFVLVNIPEEALYVLDGDSVVLRMKVIIGKPSNPTPPVDSRIERIALNPSWTLPPGPAVEQALAAVRADRDYLDSRNIQVLGSMGVEVDPRTIDWAAASTATFRQFLRQQPGPANPLGRLQFIFPNRFNLYLHDTPDKELFGERDRRKSLGCVRVEKAPELAAYLLRDDPRWPKERLASAIREGAPRTIWLPRPVDVRVVYWTAWIDERGRVQFRDDVYAGGPRPGRVELE